LKTESFCESDRESLEVIVFDKLVEIDTQHFKNDENMTSENKMVFDSDDILGVFMILITKSL
jgi:hypothetical protein